MAFDPNFPPDHQELDAGPFRDQYNALKALIDAQAARIAALESAMNGTARNPNLGEFDPGFSDPPATTDLQNIQAFINQLTTALNR